LLKKGSNQAWEYSVTILPIEKATGQEKALGSAGEMGKSPGGQ
jgi:hypothetical protein